MLTIFEEIILIKNPIALSLFIMSLAFCILDRIIKKSRGFVTVISAVLALVAVGLDILAGADLREAASLLIILLLLNMEVSDEL